MFCVHVAGEASVIRGLSITDRNTIELSWSKACLMESGLFVPISRDWGEGGVDALLHLVHTPRASHHCLHTHTYVCPDQKANIKWMHTQTPRTRLSQANTSVPGDSSRHTFITGRARKSLELRKKNNIMHFPPSHSHKDLPGPKRWSPCLRLFQRFVANYFMPPFELSVEIQLSGPLCSLQDWGGDEGRGRLERLSER